MEPNHAVSALFFTVSAVMLIVMVIFIYRALISQRLVTWFNAFYLLMIFFWAVSAFTDGLASSLGSPTDRVIACVSMESTSISLASYANIVLLKARSILAYKQSFALQQLVHVISFLSVFPTIFFIVDATAVPFAQVSLGEVALCILAILVLLLEIVFSVMFRSLHINTELKNSDKSFLIIAKYGVFCAVLLFSSLMFFLASKYIDPALMICFRISAGGICFVLFVLKAELSNDDREFDNLDSKTRLRAKSLSNSLATLAIGSRTLAASQTAIGV